MVSVEMKHLTHIDSVRDELVACGLDVGHDEEHSLGRARHGRCGEMNRAWRSGRCQLHRSKVLPDHEIGVESPPQSVVEGLGAVNVGYRDGDDLEFQIDGRGGGNAGGAWLFSADLRTAHGVLLCPRLSPRAGCRTNLPRDPASKAALHRMHAPRRTRPSDFGIGFARTSTKVSSIPSSDGSDDRRLV